MEAMVHVGVEEMGAGAGRRREGNFRPRESILQSEWACAALRSPAVKRRRSTQSGPNPEAPRWMSMLLAVFLLAH